MIFAMFENGKKLLPMKNIFLIFCLTTFAALSSNAQVAKKHFSATASNNNEYWQESNDEGNVKCGHGYFLNKMVIKTNYDSPDDLMDANDSNSSANKSTAKTTDNKLQIAVAPKNSSNVK